VGSHRLLLCLLVQLSQRLHHLIKGNGAFPTWSAAQGGSRFYCTGVGRPRGENRSFLVQAEIRIVGDVIRVVKGLRRMQQRIQVSKAGRVICRKVLASHGHILCRAT